MSSVSVSSPVHKRSTLVSTSALGEKGNAESTDASISVDGRVVAFALAQKGHREDARPDSA